MLCVAGNFLYIHMQMMNTTGYEHTYTIRCVCALISLSLSVCLSVCLSLSLCIDHRGDMTAMYGRCLHASSKSSP